MDIQMNYKINSSTYDQLYPVTQGTNVDFKKDNNIKAKQILDYNTPYKLVGGRIGLSLDQVLGYKNKIYDFSTFTTVNLASDEYFISGVSAKLSKKIGGYNTYFCTNLGKIYSETGTLIADYSSNLEGNTVNDFTFASSNVSTNTNFYVVSSLIFFTNNGVYIKQGDLTTVGTWTTFGNGIKWNCTLDKTPTYSNTIIQFVGNNGNIGKLVRSSTTDSTNNWTYTVSTNSSEGDLLWCNVSSTYGANTFFYSSKTSLFYVDGSGVRTLYTSSLQNSSQFIIKDSDKMFYHNNTINPILYYYDVKLNVFNPINISNVFVRMVTLDGMSYAVDQFGKLYDISNSTPTVISENIIEDLSVQVQGIPIIEPSSTGLQYKLNSSNMQDVLTEVGQNVTQNGKRFDNIKIPTLGDRRYSTKFLHQKFSKTGQYIASYDRNIGQLIISQDGGKNFSTSSISNLAYIEFCESDSTFYGINDLGFILKLTVNDISITSTVYTPPTSIQTELKNYIQAQPNGSFGIFKDGTGYTMIFGSSSTSTNTTVPMIRKFKATTITTTTISTTGNWTTLLTTTSGLNNNVETIAVNPSKNICIIYLIKDAYLYFYIYNFVTATLTLSTQQRLNLPHFFGNRFVFGGVNNELVVFYGLSDIYYMNIANPTSWTDASWTYTLSATIESINDEFDSIIYNSLDNKWYGMIFGIVDGRYVPCIGVSSNLVDWNIELISFSNISSTIAGTFDLKEVLEIGLNYNSITNIQFIYSNNIWEYNNSNQLATFKNVSNNINYQVKKLIYYKGLYYILLNNCIKVSKDGLVWFLFEAFDNMGTNLMCLSMFNSDFLIFTTSGSLDRIYVIDLNRTESILSTYQGTAGYSSATDITSICSNGQSIFICFSPNNRSTTGYCRFYDLDISTVTGNTSSWNNRGNVQGYINGIIATGNTTTTSNYLFVLSNYVSSTWGSQLYSTSNGTTRTALGTRITFSNSNLSRMIDIDKKTGYIYYFNGITLMKTLNFGATSEVIGTINYSMNNSYNQLVSFNNNGVSLFNVISNFAPFITYSFDKFITSAEDGKQVAFYINQQLNSINSTSFLVFSCNDKIYLSNGTNLFISKTT